MSECVSQITVNILKSIQNFTAKKALVIKKKWPMLPFWHLSILPSCHFAILPSCHFGIFPFFHFAILPSCMLKPFSISQLSQRKLKQMTKNDGKGINNAYEHDSLVVIHQQFQTVNWYLFDIIVTATILLKKLEKNDRKMTKMTYWKCF